MNEVPDMQEDGNDAQRGNTQDFRYQSIEPLIRQVRNAAKLGMNDLARETLHEMHERGELTRHQLLALLKELDVPSA